MLADIGLTPVEVAGRISASLAVKEAEDTLAVGQQPDGTLKEKAE